MMAGKKKWIQGAIEHPGAEKKAAKAAGESTRQYMEQHKDAPGKAGKRARLGLTLMGLNHNRKAEPHEQPKRRTAAERAALRYGKKE